ncbi:Uncharacterised protein [Vibrio cholerae]|nr:Uncharacterised protein [Vibrio cholerae]
MAICSSVTSLLSDKRIMFLFFEVAGRQNTEPNTPLLSK